MFKIISTELIAENITRLSVQSKRIAKKRKPGQFVIVRVVAGAERIPLTVVDSDIERGTIDLIVQSVGKNTKAIAALKQNDHLLDVAGPLGNATHLEKYGTCVVIGGGVGIAPLFPIAKGLKEIGNSIISILGGRSSRHLILQKELAELSTECIVTTDDGSSGRKGLVTDALLDMIQSGKKIDFVFAVGPIVMMEAVCLLTKKYGIKTMVSLNPIMIDGTGMCGGCRCTVGGEVKFACVDGPEFDGHQVDFQNLKQRLRMFHAHEKRAHHGDGGCHLK
jgi:ferredoxin--NADP+ reductase